MARHEASLSKMAHSKKTTRERERKELVSTRAQLNMNGCPHGKEVAISIAIPNITASLRAEILRSSQMLLQLYI